MKLLPTSAQAADAVLDAYEALFAETAERSGLPPYPAFVNRMRAVLCETCGEHLYTYNVETYPNGAPFARKCSNGHVNAPFATPGDATASGNRAAGWETNRDCAGVAEAGGMSEGQPPNVPRATGVKE